MLFINFRVGDGEDKAAWLDAEFAAVFGRDGVFRSSRSIQLGHDFEPILWGAVEDCAAMVVVIGERWLSDFRDRLFDPQDVVRREIATALNAGKPVVPVLGHGGRMHRADELPTDLAGLASYQYVRLTYRDAHMLPGLVERLIESAPDLGIGVRDGIKGLAAWQRERISSVRSVLPEDLVLLGRDSEVEALLSWLSGPPGNLVVHGQTVDEVAEFVAVVLDRHDLAHRSVIVSSSAGWEHAAKISPSAPVVVVSDDVAVGHDQVNRHVIVARDGFGRRSDGVFLPRTPRDKARDAFLAEGEPSHRADELAGLVRRSRRALIRRFSPNDPRPEWTREPASAIAAPLALVGRWSATSDADHAIVSRIAGQDYAAVERFAEPSARSGDPFVHRSGTRWQLADPFDAWSQLMAHMTSTDLGRFTQAAIEVLGEIDPVLSLPDPEVPSAGINGITRTWSEELRQGLAHGLARLGDTGTEVVAGGTAESRADSVVHQLLRQANGDRTGLLWRSLTDVLPLLAEAAPRVFVAAVDTGLRGQEPLLSLMFEDTDGRTLHRHSAHTGLLWALETLTWAPEYSVSATLLLARLATCDPGGRLSNRPANSLASLLTHRPLGPIPLGRRPAIIDQIRSRHPDVGWQLLNDLTDPRALLMYPERPRVRHDWTGSDSAPVDSIEAYRDAVFSAVLTDLAAVPTRWVEYLPRITNLPPTCRELLLADLEALDVAALPPETTRALWDQGNRILGRERGYGDEHRNLSHEHADRLTAVMATIEPTSDPTRHAWLFTWHPPLPGVDLTDHDTHRAAVEHRREEIVAAELEQHGVDGLARLAEASDLGHAVGWTLARVAPDTLQEEVLSQIGTPMTEGWIRRRAQNGGRDWAVQAVDSMAEDPNARVAFLLALPVEWAVELLDRQPFDMKERFWTLTPAFPFPADGAESYLAEILGRGRSEAVIDALSLALHGKDQPWRPSVELLRAALHALLMQPGQVTSHTAYAVGKLLDYLYITGHDLAEQAMFEVAFAPLLHDRQPRALVERIMRDPAAFLELHQFRFLPTEKLNPKAMGFYMTAESLRCVPGQTGEQVDRAHLLDWVRQTRTLLSEAGMLPSGDRAIGTLISAGPDGQDGAWPTEAIRDILDLDDAHDLREGFLHGLFNGVGFTWRGVYDGGQQERQQAAKYETWADQIDTTWPHTAQTLRDHADSLHALARRADREAEDDHDE